MPYLDPAQPYHVRQASLKATYGFECRCARCLLDKSRISSIPPAPENSSEYLRLYPTLIAHVFGQAATTTLLEQLSTLPEKCYSPLPTELYLLLNDTHLPFLSARFRDASHDHVTIIARETGIALLAIYLTIYPVAYPVVGS